MKQILSLFALALCASAADVTVRFDKPLQEWDGFGVNYVELSKTRDYTQWKQDYGGFSILNEQRRAEILDLMFGDDGLRPGLVKMFLDPFHEPANDNSDPYSIRLEGYDHETTTKQMRHFVRRGLEMTRARGGDLRIIATMYGPAPWMTAQKMVRGRDLDPAHRVEAAEYLASWAKYLRDREKFPVQYVSIHNEGEHAIRYEPDGRDTPEHIKDDYNLLWKPTELADFMCTLRDVLDRNGMQEVGVTPGETTYWLWFRPFAEAIAAKPCALKAMGLITSHGFRASDDPSADWYMPDWADPVPIRRLQSLRPELKAWTTSDGFGKHDVKFAEGVQRHLYVNRVNAYIPWAPIQRPAEWKTLDSNRGIVTVNEDGTYTVERGYFLYKQFTRAGQPGMRVASAESDDPFLLVVGFARNGTKYPDAFAVINRTWSPITARISVSGTKATRFGVTRTVTHTVPKKFWVGELPPEEKYKSHPAVAAKGGVIEYTAPGLSVTTFTAE